MKPKAWMLLRVAFGVAGLVFIGFALARTVDRSGQDVIPSWPYLVIAEVLAISGLLIGSRAWTSLFVEGSGAELRRGFYASQLGKYIPGAVWQTVALVGSASRAGAGVARSSIRFPVYAATTIAAGGTVGAGLSVVGRSDLGPARLASLAGLLTILLLDRRGMMLAVRAFRRITGREISEDALPSQEAIIRSYLFGLGSVIVGSAAFAVLLESFHTRVSAAEATTAFALAWTAGFVAIPFPSGLGIREAVLIGALATGLGSPIVSAAVAQRIVLMVGELVVVLSTNVRKPARVS